MKRPTFPCDFAHVLKSADERPHVAASDDDALFREYAALEFEPIDVRPSDLPSNEDWVGMINPHLVSLRLSAILLSKTKDQLIEHTGSMRGKHELDEMIRGLTGVSELMQFYHRFSDMALARVLCALATIEAREGDAA